MMWTKAKIVNELRILYKKGTDISYNSLTRKKQALVSAASYHFGAYRAAVKAAGIDYADVIHRPRWTKAMIIKTIKQSKKKKIPLNWSSVIKRRDTLGKAAFASVHHRLFGSWDKALKSSGLNVETEALYRNWSRVTIVKELKARTARKQLCNSGALQVERPGLHAAAVRYFGTYDKALQASGIDPLRTRKRSTKLKRSARSPKRKMS